MGKVLAVCLSEAKGTQKKDVQKALLVVQHGLSGDAHAGDWHRQVSLLSHDKIEEFRARGAQVQHGAFGENLVVEGVDFAALPVGTHFFVGDAELELTQIGKECHHGCAIFRQMGDCIMPRQGVFARVLCGGEVQVGDELSWQKPENGYRVAVLTASDKGAAGQRQDESGPLVAQLARQEGYRVVENLLLPDDQPALEAALRRLCDENAADLVLSTGGTGFAPRDCMPEATLAVCERPAPGIAEAMRAASMQVTGRAMLSRGVAALRKQTLIVNLPGSPKAARENLLAVLPQLAHGLDMLTAKAGECAQNPALQG